MGAPDPGTAQTADVFGDEFSQGAQAISSEAVFFRSAAVATKATAALRGARAVPCARASVRPVVAEQLRLQGIKATIKSIDVTRYTVAVEGVVSAFRVVVVLAATGASITVQRDVVVLGLGRAQVRATFLDVGRAFSSNLELSLVKALSGKLVRK